MLEQQIRFFASTPHRCGYLDDREAISLFVDPDYQMSPRLYTYLVRMGFRRSGDHVYKPFCGECQACMPARIPLDQFQMTRSQKRIWKANSDLSVKISKPQYTEEIYQLYQKYVTTRHAGGDMDNPEPTRFRHFLHSEWCHSYFYRFYLGERLIAVAVTDHLYDGLSAFYTFFDPDMEKRSLGTYAILWQIQSALENRMSWLYLGYWIEDCRKMNYKSRFQPLEVLAKDKWQSQAEYLANRTTTQITDEEPAWV